MPTEPTKLPPGTALLAGLDVPACVADASSDDFPLIWGNDAFNALAGDAIGKPMAESLGGSVAGTARAVVSGSGASRIDSVLREAGHVEVAVSAVEGYVVCLVLDSDAKAVELREAKQSGRRWRTLVETVPAALFRADWSEEAAFRYISPQIEDILGHPPKYFLTGRMAWASLLHPKDRDTYLAAETESYRSGRPLDTEYRMVTKDGEVKRIYEREAIVRDDAGRPRYSHGILLDMTHRRA